MHECCRKVPSGTLPVNGQLACLVTESMVRFAARSWNASSVMLFCTNNKLVLHLQSHGERWRYDSHSRDALTAPIVEPGVARSFCASILSTASCVWGQRQAFVEAHTTLNGLTRESCPSSFLYNESTLQSTYKEAKELDSVGHGRTCILSEHIRVVI